jgi:hypothetical protein
VDLRAQAVANANLVIVQYSSDEVADRDVVEAKLKEAYAALEV